MRWTVAFAVVLGLGTLCMVSCTANVAGYSESIGVRVDQACGELAALCQSSGRGCAEQTTFCGPLKPELAKFFATEDSCKDSCGNQFGCVHQCKATRQLSVTQLLATRDLDGDGEVGDGTAVCSNLTTLCTTSPEACPASEFFCTAAAPAPNPCSAELDACKANCAPRDRVCRSACREQYRQCLAGPQPDAGVPDAPPMTTTYDLTYSTTGTGSGTIARNPAGTSCGTNCATYSAGTMVTLTATAATGSTFTGWTGCTSATNTCTVTMNQALTVTAAFTASTPTTYNLTYGTTAGSTGSGTIARNPAGTSCGTNCATYAANTSVTLTATPATGSTFAGWTGCTSTTNTCTVVMTKALTVTAKFNLQGYTYTKDITPVMTGLCNGCHGDQFAPQGYRTDTYTGLLGNGSDTVPNIIPGDATSKFVVYVGNNHKGVLNTYPGFDKVAHDWVVLYNAAQ